MYTGVYVFLYSLCDRELALILLVVTGFSVDLTHWVVGVIAPGKAACNHVESCGRGMGRRVRGLCLWQPPHVCLCGGAELPGVEPWLQGNDCYSTGVGFKNAFLMGMHFTGKSTEIWEGNITVTGYRSSACVCDWRRFISGNSLPSAVQLRNNIASLLKTQGLTFLQIF